MLVVVCLRGKNLATKETNEHHLRNETRASENAAECIPRQTTLKEHFKNTLPETPMHTKSSCTLGNNGGLYWCGNSAVVTKERRKRQR